MTWLHLKVNIYENIFEMSKFSQYEFKIWTFWLKEFTPRFG
jgi:hypothetical protein